MDVENVGGGGNHLDHKDRGRGGKKKKRTFWFQTLNRIIFESFFNKIKINT